MTGVPPVSGPALGWIPVTCSALWYANVTALDEKSARLFVTLTLARSSPREAGATQRTVSALSHIARLGGASANWQLSVSCGRKWRPSIVTSVPPSSGPSCGQTESTTTGSWNA